MRFLMVAATAGLSVFIATQAAAQEPLQLHMEVRGGIEIIHQAQDHIRIANTNGTWQTLGLAKNKLTLSPAPRPDLPTSDDPDRLPDTEMATGHKNIHRTWLARPTKRYGHGVLGDAIEAGSIKAELSSGEILEYILPENAVFEDRTPRLFDINGDGKDEIIVVKSDLKQGAALVLVGEVNGKLEIIVEAPAIGQSHRWLNPIGAADFDGDGKTEIAVVITPHIGGTLRLYEWHGSRLVGDHSAFGFSNHAMGSRELGQSAIMDVDGDGVLDIVAPNSTRSALMSVSFAKGSAKILSHADLPGPLSSGLYVTDLNEDGNSEILFATNNSTLTLLRWSQ